MGGTAVGETGFAFVALAYEERAEAVVPVAAIEEEALADCCVWVEDGIEFAGLVIR